MEIDSIRSRLEDRNLPAEQREELRLRGAELLQRAGDLGTAREWLDRILEWAVASQKHALLQDCYRVRAETELRAGDAVKADAYLSKALHLAEKQEDPRRRAEAWYLSAWLALSAGDEESVEVRLSRAPSDSSVRGKLLRAWGALVRLDGEAAACEVEGLELDDPDDRALAAAIRADLARLRGDPEEELRQIDSLQGISFSLVPEEWTAALRRRGTALREPKADRALSGVLDVMRRASRVREPRLVVDYTLLLLLEATGAERALALVCSRGKLEAEVSRTRTGGRLEGTHLQFSRRIVQGALQSGRDLRSRGLDAAVEGGSIRALGLSDALAYPLRSRGRLVGALYADTSAPGGLGEFDPELVRALADQAAILLDRVEPTEEGAPEPDELLLSRRGRLALAMLARLAECENVDAALRGALETLSTVTEASRGHLLAPADGEWRAQASVPEGTHAADFSTGALERALREGRPILVSDARGEGTGGTSIRRLDIGSVLCVPVLSGSDPVAAVYLHRDASRKAFLEEDLRLAGMVANRIGPLLAKERLLAERTREVGELREVVRRGLSELAQRHSFGQLLGRSPAMQELYRNLEKLSEVDYPALFEGETGAGKELAARAVHFNGRRRERPFLAVNCAALSETLLDSELFGHAKGAFTGADQPRKGLFELADEGTLFLDEIEEMSAAMQKKLLRVLEDSTFRPVGARDEVRVNVRILGATNRKLKELVSEGAFREDLYYRLSALTVRLPSLRERAEDVGLLAERFLEEACRETGTAKKFAPDTLRTLARYDWPGNVRELRNEIRRLVTFAPETIRPENLPAHIRECGIADTRRIRSGAYKTRLEETDKQILLDALRASEWNLRATARALKIGRNTLARKMEKYGIEVPKTG